MEHDFHCLRALGIHWRDNQHLYIFLVRAWFSAYVYLHCHLALARMCDLTGSWDCCVRQGLRGEVKISST